MFPFQFPGGGELIVIIIIIVVLFGGGKAVSSIKNLGKETAKLKKEVDDLKNEVKIDAIDILDIKDKD
jgi:Sec-independent protein translocase protein TatA